MKKNILIIVGVALVGAVTLTFDSLRAQDAATPPTAQQVQPPVNRPMPQPGFRSRMAGGSYRNAITFLRRVKQELQQSTDDFDGHRQSAMDACDKAVQELEAVQKSIQAKMPQPTPLNNAAPAPAPATAPAPAPAPAPNQ